MTKSKKINYKLKTKSKKTRKYIGSGNIIGKIAEQIIPETNTQEEEEKKLQEEEEKKLQEEYYNYDDLEASTSDEAERIQNEHDDTILRREMERMHPNNTKEEITKKIEELEDWEKLHIINPDTAPEGEHHPSLFFGGKRSKNKLIKRKTFNFVSKSFVEKIKLQQLGGQKKIEASYILNSIRKKRK